MTDSPDGKRLSLTDASGTRKFFYDFDDVIQEYNSSWSGVTKEYTHGCPRHTDEFSTSHCPRSASHVPSSPKPPTRRASGASAHSAGAEALRPNTTHYLMKDRLGSIINILDSNETLKTTYSYDAFGEPTATHHSGQVDCMYRFTGAHGTRMSSRLRITRGRLRTCRARLGRRRDAQAAPRPVAWERRLSAFYRARYYNQSLGRFFSRDPIFSLQSLYSYCANSPTNFTDPMGLEKTEVQQQEEQEQGELPKDPPPLGPVGDKKKDQPRFSTMCLMVGAFLGGLVLIASGNSVGIAAGTITIVGVISYAAEESGGGGSGSGGYYSRDEAAGGFPVYSLGGESSFLVPIPRGLNPRIPWSSPRFDPKDGF